MTDAVIKEQFHTMASKDVQNLHLAKLGRDAIIDIIINVAEF